MQKQLLKLNKMLFRFGYVKKNVRKEVWFCIHHFHSAKIDLFRSWLQLQLGFNFLFIYNHRNVQYYLFILGMLISLYTKKVTCTKIQNTSFLLDAYPINKFWQCSQMSSTNGSHQAHKFDDSFIFHWNVWFTFSSTILFLCFQTTQKNAAFHAFPFLLPLPFS